ncbi:MAG: MFS transporter, partial [Alphaproteobacteria bacterium]|nr:MFS transporter [Alphaproteobacteria bacterium]
KIYGMAATILGGLYGGVFLKKIGLYRGLYICCFLQGITTAFYAVQAYVGHSVTLLTLTISLENFSSGMATAALVAYMSSLCHIAYTATQYALLSSLMSLARDFFAATSGWLLEQTSWPIFFIIAGLMSLPAALIVKKLDTLPAKNT